MDEPQDQPPRQEQPATADLLTIGLLVFFLALMGIATALLVLPNLQPPLPSGASIGSIRP